MVTREIFGQMPDGREVPAYRIENRRLKARVSALGAVLLELWVPDRDGNAVDVVLGHRTIEGYFTNPVCFGASVGPHANRIAGASFVLEGKEYHLEANNGANNLHSGGRFHTSLFDSDVDENGDSVTFSLHTADLEDRFPGNRDFSITYTLTEEELRIDYRCVSDAATIFNLTNHSYFNLKGAGCGDVLGHVLELHCSAFTPTDSASIPTGEIRPVEGTAFDFREPAVIGDKMDLSQEMLKVTNGYDHNFCIDGYKGGKDLLFAGRVTDPGSGRRMEVYTTAPGVQIYTFNWDPCEEGKDGKSYPRYGGIAMETQFYPDSMHHDAFPSPVFGPGEPFISTTIFRFPPA